MEKLWNDWTEEDWSNAVFCSDCGLPMFQIEDGANVGHYHCAWCEWVKDEEHYNQTLKLKISRLDSQIREMKDALSLIHEATIRHFPPNMTYVDAAQAIRVIGEKAEWADRFSDGVILTDFRNLIDLNREFMKTYPKNPYGVSDVGNEKEEE